MRMGVMAAALVLLAAPLAGHEVAPVQAAPVQRVLAVFAHPDDEIPVAPALAALRRQGAAVTVLYATSGDAGPGVSGLAKGAGLARVREGEARCSIAALGGGEIRFLGLGDGMLADAADKDGSAARRLGEALDEVLAAAPHDLVLTWGPDGGYGHPDHRMVHALVTERVQARSGDRPQLLYPGIRAGTLPPVPEMQRWAVIDPVLLTRRIVYTNADLAAARAAVACHETQFAADQRAAIADLFHASIWQGAVHFRPAFAPPR